MGGTKGRVDSFRKTCARNDSESRTTQDLSLLDWFQGLSDERLFERMDPSKLNKLSRKDSDGGGLLLLLLLLLLSFC